MKVTARQARISLVLCFIGSLALALALAGYALFARKIYPDELKMIVIASLTSYSVPLGTILAGVFARKSGRSARHATTPAVVALALSVLWNLLLLGRVARFAFAPSDDVEELRDWMATVSAGGSFLVAAALTYYFSSDDAPRARAGAPTRDAR